MTFLKLNFFRNRSYRRRSSTPPKRDARKQSLSPQPAKSIEPKTPNKVEPARKKDEADDIAELERRVQEAKKVLEVMVKEKMKEKRRSSSREARSRSKKRSKKSRRDSSSD